MQSSTRRDRLIAALVFSFAAWLHAQAFSNPTSDMGWFIYHATAATTSLLIIAIADIIIDGKLLHDIQYINIAAIITNCVGWVAYMCYVQPIYYNSAIHILFIAQIIRLIIPDAGFNYKNSIRRRIFRANNPDRKNHHRKEAY